MLAQDSSILVYGSYLATLAGRAHGGLVERYAPGLLLEGVAALNRDGESAEAKVGILDVTRLMNRSGIGFPSVCDELMVACFESFGHG